MTRPNRSDFDRLRKFIEHGWRKLNTVGSHTYVGESPCYDLYWAVRALDQRFPVQPNLDPIFLKLAHTIAELYSIARSYNEFMVFLHVCGDWNRRRDREIERGVRHLLASCTGGEALVAGFRPGTGQP